MTWYDIAINFCPSGFDIPEPRTLAVSPKRERSFNNLPPPPPPTLNNSAMHPANGAFDVDLVSQQFGPQALLNNNGAGQGQKSRFEKQKKYHFPI